MPLLRYFVVVGLSLLGLIIASNYWLASPTVTDKAIASAANEPVKDALYFWRQEEARKKAPVHNQLTTIPSTAIAMGNGIAVADRATDAGATAVQHRSIDVSAQANPNDGRLRPTPASAGPKVVHRKFARTELRPTSSRRRQAEPREASASVFPEPFW